MSREKLELGDLVKHHLFGVGEITRFNMSGNMVKFKDWDDEMCLPSWRLKFVSHGEKIKISEPSHRFLKIKSELNSFNAIQRREIAKAILASEEEELTPNVGKMISCTTCAKRHKCSYFQVIEPQLVHMEWSGTLPKLKTLTILAELGKNCWCFKYEK